ncbi:putative ACR COG1678 [Lotmaria passim]
MEKVVLTTYRKLYKMCRRVDASVAMRTQLVCCPLRVYDHRMMEWQTFDISQMEWAESRSYLDALIRRLNNGSPQYIPPLPEEEARAVEEYKVQCAFVLAEEERREAAAATMATKKPAASKATAPSKNTASSTDTASPSTPDDNLPSGSRGSAIPLNVLPYTRLTVALRQIFEETPFSVSNVANGFAVVKELQYVCDLETAGKATRITLSTTPAEGASPLTSTANIPPFQRVTDVALLHNSLIHGLSPEQRMSLDRQSRLVRRIARKRKLKKNTPLASAAAGASDERQTGRNAFDEAPEVEAEAEEAMADSDEGDAAAGETDLSDKVEGDDPLDEAKAAAEGAAAQATQSATATAGEELHGGLPSTAELMAEPKQVQLLLAHPTARGFFRRTVLLMVRHVTHESAAFVLNKPLRNDEGVEMTIEATVRLGRVHPIYRRHLTQHTLMIGGPVMSGSSFDESIFLLHRVPGIPNALPLGSGLWMDGDLDALMTKLDAKEASAEKDIIVLCGFAGWGFDQLKGELSNGYWVVASASSADPAIGPFVMSLAHTASGQHPQREGQQGTGAVFSSSAAAAAAEQPSAATSPTAHAAVDATSHTTAAAAAAAAPSDAAATTAPPPSSQSEEGENIREQAQRAADAAASRAIPSLKQRRRRADAGKGKGDRIETLSWVRAYASLGKPYSEMAMNQKAYAKDDDSQE